MSVPLQKLAEVAGDPDRSMFDRVLALLYADRFHGGSSPVPPEEIALVLDLTLSDVNTTIEALQVRGLVAEAPDASPAP